MLLPEVQRKTTRFLFLDTWVGPPATRSLVVAPRRAHEEPKRRTDCEGLDHKRFHG